MAYLSVVVAKKEGMLNLRLVSFVELSLKENRVRASRIKGGFVVDKSLDYIR